MERAPVPPHERTWRHPSELAAGTRAAVMAEPAATSAKLLTVSVGAFTLLALAVVVVSFTPDRADDRLADRSTPSTVASALLTAGRTFMAELTSTDDDRPAVTTVAAAPSGVATRGTSANVLFELQGAGSLVVSLPVADRSPDPGDVVTALTDPPVDASFGRLRATLVVVDAPNGTAVVDTSGRLVGVWTTADGPPRLIPSGELAAAQARAVRHDGATTDDPD